MIVTYADKGEKGSVTQDAAEAMAPLFDDFVDVIALFGVGIGLCLAAFGLINLLMSMTETGSGENRKSAAVLLVVGFILIFCKPILHSLNLSSYLSGGGSSTKQTQTQVDETPPQ